MKLFLTKVQCFMRNIAKVFWDDGPCNVDEWVGLIMAIIMAASVAVAIIPPFLTVYSQGDSFLLPALAINMVIVQSSIVCLYFFVGMLGVFGTIVGTIFVFVGVLHFFYRLFQKARGRVT